MLHFKTDSYPMQVSRIQCDKEIGSPKRGWHVCKAAGTRTVESRVCAGLWLHYCAKHAPFSASTI